MASDAMQLSVVQASGGSDTALNPATQRPNPRQAAPQANSYIEDTVTLTAQATQSQQAPQPPSTQPAQGGAVGAQVQALNGTAATPNQTPTPDNVQQPPAPALTPAAAPAASPAGAATSTAPSNSKSAATQQQQLAQLEDILQQLGIDPDTLSMSDLTAMLPPDATDPAAILAYVQQFLGTTASAAPQSNHVNVTA